MKEMVYRPIRCAPEQLASGTYRGFDYYVLSLGTHPCAYVDISDYAQCESLREAVATRDIECHGGITYEDTRLATVEHEGWFIGWDYSPCTDYAGYLPSRFEYLKKWATFEIVEECRNVIDRIVQSIVLGPTLERYLSAWLELYELRDSVSPTDITAYVNTRAQFRELCRGDAMFCSANEAGGVREYGKIFNIPVYVDWTPQEAASLFCCGKYPKEEVVKNEH